MNKSRKLMSLLLVLVLALPMVFSLSALAEEKATTDLWVVQTSGGRLNVWADAVKKANTSVGSIANGKVIEKLGGRTYSTADKVWMEKISYQGLVGWVDAKYIGKKTVLTKTYKEEGTDLESESYTGVVNTTGGKVNIWANTNFTGKIMSIANGKVIGTIVPVAGKAYSKVYNEDGFVGYIRNKYVAKPEKAPTPPVIKNYYEKAKVVGTAPNSVINLWGDKVLLNAKGQKALMQLPLGHMFDYVENWTNGWSYVWFETANKKWVDGWVQTKYLGNQGEVLPADFFDEVVEEEPAE